jgi:hypothetical protein
MHRHFRNVFLALVALGLVFAGPVTAGEEDALREKVRELEQKVEALSGQQSTQLDESIDDYLESSSAWQAAQADDDGMSKVRITAALTANSQNEFNEVNDGQGTFAIVSGDVDLGFHIDVTENLQLHITGSASTTGQQNIGETVGRRSLSAADDGVGTNGNTTVTGRGRAFNLYEAYIVHGIKAGNSKVYWEIGMVDPRNRFLQNAFADDENTQFMNNLFDDVSTWNWGTSGLLAAGFPGILGLHAWYAFGKDGMHTINAGYFNVGGRFWDQGVFAIQYSLKLKVAGRDMNVRVAIQYDNALKDGDGDARLSWGISWDWWVTEKIGAFARFSGTDDGATAANGNTPVVSVDFDWQVGAEFHIIGNRKDDYFGAALGMNANPLSGPNAEDELIFEVYYLFAVEEGKAQITPYIMYVGNFGGTSAPGTNDAIILGIRIHVPF